MKKCSELIEERKNTQDGDATWLHLVWGKDFPAKIQVFLWSALQDAIATKGFFSKEKSSWTQ